IGPKHTITALGKTILPSGTWIPGLTPPGNDLESLGRGLGQLYVKGVPIHWPGVYNNTRLRKAELPTYPFQMRRYWIDEPSDLPYPRTNGSGQSRPEHPLLGEEMLLADNDRVVFSAHINACNPTFLKDHCVYDHIVFPATGYIEILLASAKRILHTE